MKCGKNIQKDQVTAAKLLYMCMQARYLKPGQIKSVFHSQTFWNKLQILKTSHLYASERYGLRNLAANFFRFPALLLRSPLRLSPLHFR